MKMKEIIEVSNEINYQELNDLLNNVTGHRIHLSNYERLENGYRLYFEKTWEKSRINVDDFLYLYERTDQLKINLNFNIEFYSYYPNSLKYIELYFPEIKKYIKNNEISTIRFNIYDNYDTIRYERIEERLNIHRKYYNAFKEKAENGELSALVVSALIYKFHNGEDLDSCCLNLDLHSMDAGVLKYLDNPISLEKIFESKCFNEYETEDLYLIVNHDNINFIKTNTIISCNNPYVYLNRPEIKFLNCLSKYFNKLEMSR